MLSNALFAQHSRYVILPASNQHIFQVAFETLYGSLVFQFLHCVPNENVKITGEPSSYNTVAVESTSAADL